MIITDPFEFTKCEDCLRNNDPYYGSCRGCIHDKNAVNYFYHKLFDWEAERK